MARMTSIYIGVSGLQSAQTALNTTSHNLANVYTKGYTRQLSFTSDRTYNTIGQSSTSFKQVGLGVETSSTSRVRDILLDRRYRTESGRQGFYEAQYEVVSEIEAIIGETEGVQFQKTLENLWSAISEMAKTPDSIVSRSEFVMCCEEFMERSQAIYGELTDYQKNLDTKIQKSVDKINSIAERIYDLNLKISGIESTVEDANDMRDERDLLLDELSEYVNIKYTEDVNKFVSINVEGVPLVSEGGTFKMAAKELNSEDGSLYMSCVWPYLDDTEVFNLEETISTANQNDIGSLKGYLLARGDFVGDYTDVPNKANFDLNTPEGQQKYKLAVQEYNKKVNPCIVTKTQALFDKLVNGIVTGINDILSPLTDKVPDGVTEYTDAKGNVYAADSVRILDTNTSTGDDGKMPPQEVFKRTITDRYIEVTGNDGNTYYVYNEKNTFGSDSLYSIPNLTLNQVILEDYSKLPFKTLEGDNDLDKGAKLVSMWNDEAMEFDPNNSAKLEYKQFYNQIVYTVGNVGDMYSSIASNQDRATAEIDSARTQVTGVSSEDELTNMIKFQSAYNASSRYITTIADMLEYIIERLGA